MTNQSPTVLLTRPAAFSEEFRVLLGKQANVVISPVFEVQPLEISADIAGFDAIVFASRNAVMAAAGSLDLNGFKAITVGDQTAAVAERFGMSVVSANGASDELVAAVARDHPAGKVLFIHGEHTIGDVANRLRARGLTVETIEAYRQVPQEVSNQARTALCAPVPVVLPLFSPRSALLVSGLIGKLQATAPLILIGMSTGIVAAWTGPGLVETVVAAQKTAAAMAKETLRILAERS